MDNKYSCKFCSLFSKVKKKPVLIFMVKKKPTPFLDQKKVNLLSAEQVHIFC